MVKKRKIYRKLEKNNRSGFTLAELLIASAILVITMAGILVSYLRCLELNEISANSSMATKGAMSRMEQIKSDTFANLVANYHNVPFTVTGLNGMGVSYVDTTNPEMYEITISVSWQQNNGRVFGEDLDIDGVLDAGEDSNGNGILDSPVLLVNNIFDR